MKKTRGTGYVCRKGHIIPQRLKALRSGKYRQTTSVLERLTKDGKVKGNCCLGILCRVDKVRSSSGETATFFSGSDTMLTHSLLRRFGLNFMQQEELAAMNDGSFYRGKRYPRRSFKTIAYWIEKNIPATK